MSRSNDPVELYHGSHEVLTEITDEGMFGGVFASGSENVALSHGPMLHELLIDADEIAETADLNFRCEPAVIERVLADYGPEHLDNLWSAVVDEDDSVVEELIGVLGSDWADASWGAQRVRGDVAKACGYLAIEMTDEHGTTYLVLPGAPIRFLGSFE